MAENGLTDEDIRQNGIVSHKVDYIRYWKELEPLRKFLSDYYFSTFKAHLVIITFVNYSLSLSLYIYSYFNTSEYMKNISIS